MLFIYKHISQSYLKIRNLIKKIFIIQTQMSKIFVIAFIVCYTINDYLKKQKKA